MGVDLERAIDGLLERQSRRRFLTLLALSTASLLAPPTAAGSSEAIGGWATRLEHLTDGLTPDPIATRAWRRRALQLTRRVSPETLRRATKLDALAASLRSVPGAEPQWRITLPPPHGLRGFSFTTILARIDAGATVPAHGHHNMVSMHVVLSGAVRVRQYDRLWDEPTHVGLRPRLDRVCRPGEATAIAADRGNVHVFEGIVDAVALIVAAYGLDPRGPTGRDYVDLDAAEPMADGSLRVPLVGGPS